MFSIQTNHKYAEAQLEILWEKILTGFYLLIWWDGIWIDRRQKFETRIHRPISFIQLNTKKSLTLCLLSGKQTINLQFLNTRLANDKIKMAEVDKYTVKIPQ